MSMQIKAGVKNYRLTLLAQSFLQYLGYEISALDGVFGPETDRAVKQFQDDYDLQVDGVVGTQTWKVLLRVVEPALEQGEMHGEDGEQLGMVSAKWESNGKADAIGYDGHGGYSYGLYQISTRQGTMVEFLLFLEEKSSSIYDVLMQAGGGWGATNGSDQFRQAWKELAHTQNKLFASLQNQFIASTHFYPLYRKLVAELFKDIAISFSLKNVIWSIGVQHGTSGGFNLIKRALQGCDLRETEEGEIIRRIYGERSKVDVYFPSSTVSVKKSVLKRFKEEEQLALALGREDERLAA